MKIFQILKHDFNFDILEPKKHSFSISALVGEDSDHESQESHDSAQIEEIVDVVSDQVIIQVFFTFDFEIFRKFQKIETQKKKSNFEKSKSRNFSKVQKSIEIRQILTFILIEL